MKYKRQSKIIKIVKSTPVHTHDELIAELNAEGFNVTQATVSRDIKELGLIKVPSADGAAVYSLPEKGSESGITRIDMVSESVKNVAVALHTIVINTYPGMASAVAAAVDTVFKDEVLGCVAGDDTIIIVTDSVEAAAELGSKMKTVFKAE